MRRVRKRMIDVWEKKKKRKDKVPEFHRKADIVSETD